MSLSDYLHLMKPRIIPLLLFVGVGSAVVAGHSVPPLRVTLGILLGGGLASAGSLALNSYLERGIDARMNRTKGRPLPSGRIMPPANALLLAAVLLFAGFLLSYLLLNLVATLFIILGATIYISLYTILLKPRTTWNIVLGGSAGSCAALAGWYSVTFSDPLAAGLLAALIFVWTPSHFWSLAVITEEDYSAVGIPMLPSVVGAGRASRFIVANTLILIPVSLLLTPFFPGTGLFIYLPAASVMNALLLATNIKLLLSPTKSNAWLAFKFSSPYLAIVFTFAMVAALV
ncbi:MAG: protoheme IX farnesyltransferase [Thaumarchaeota archaeon]|nr:MAG: protoheme IX farnesyltransferase [Nitrososphaerota archaeon]